MRAARRTGLQREGAGVPSRRAGPRGMPPTHLQVATEEEIRAGRVTDVYFTRTQEILRARKIRRRVVAEFVVKRFPGDTTWGVFAGLEECATVLQGLPVAVGAVPEGTVFRAHEPVLTIEGEYGAFAVFETALLGFLCQASGVATKAARCRKLAGERTVYSFGERRMHPAISPMIERSAYIGGCDGVSGVTSAARLGVAPVGTMPHALVLLLGDTVEALTAFHAVVDRRVPRVALVDTLGDERFEAVRAAEALGPALTGVRLDTPASRRGDFLQLLNEVRWELDLRGFQHVKLVVSGGIDEAAIRQLNPVADAYGIGAAISNAPVLDFAMDIVEMEGKPVAKRGKLSGVKRLQRCPLCYTSRLVPKGARAAGPCACGGQPELLLHPWMSDGALLHPHPAPPQIRQSVLKQLAHYDV